jgi:hypothetical protein
MYVGMQLRPLTMSMKYNERKKTLWLLSFIIMKMSSANGHLNENGNILSQYQYAIIINGENVSVSVAWRLAENDVCRRLSVGSAGVSGVTISAALNGISSASMKINNQSLSINGMSASYQYSKCSMSLSMALAYQ